MGPTTLSRKIAWTLEGKFFSTVRGLPLAAASYKNFSLSRCNAMIQWLCWRFQKYQLIIDYALASSSLALAWWIFWFVVDLDNSLLVKHPALPIFSWQVLKYMLCRLITERKTTNLGLDWLLGSKLQHRCCFIILAGKIYYLFIFPFELNQRWCTWVTLSQGGISWASFSSRYSSLEFAFFI